MKFKLYLILFTCFFQVPNVFGQVYHNQNVNFGDKYFQTENYYTAFLFYTKAISQGIDDHYIQYQLGECERLMFKYVEAEKHYQSVIETGKSDYKKTILWYAICLKSNGKYHESIEYFDAFLSNPDAELTDKNLAIHQRSGALMAIAEMKKPYRSYDLQDLPSPVNSKESDFAPIVLDNDSSIMISSGRFVKKHEEVDKSLGGSMLDYFLFNKSDTTWLKKQQNDHLLRTNSPYHEASGVFNTDKSVFLFTRCNDKGNNKAEIHCAIYATIKKNNSWSDPKEISRNVNLIDTWNAHPSLTASGDTLIFASKRSGGIGQSDLWMSIKSNQDWINGWSDVVNLGPKINTPNNEMFPTMYIKENRLLFSSNGHDGYGGLDLFVSEPGKYHKIRNLGLPFNSAHDDFHMSLGDTLGYFSSNREESFGLDDIWRFNQYTPLGRVATIEKNEDGSHDFADVSGIITAEKPEDLKNIKLEMQEENGSNIKIIDLNKNGKFVINDVDLATTKFLNIRFPNEHFLSPKTYKIDSLNIRLKSTNIVDATIDTSTIDIGGVVVNKVGKPVEGATVRLRDENGLELMLTKTNEKGEFLFRSLPSNKKYLVTTDDPNNKIKDVQTYKNKKGVNLSSLEDANKGVASRIEINSIYFDFEKFNLRKEAKETLDKILDSLKKFPNITLELHGYTDGIGASNYNVKLGKKRGESALNYLIKNGVEAYRIQVRSFGKSNPVADNNTNEGRQLNRRVEFFLLGGVKYNEAAQIHVVKKGETYYSISKKYGMKIEDLINLNGFKANEYLKENARIKVQNLNKIDTSKDLVFENVQESSENRKESFVENMDYVVRYNQYKKGIKYRSSLDKGYTVVLAENTMFGIAQIFNVNVEDLKKRNNLMNNIIYEGQVIQVSENPEVSKSTFVKEHIEKMSKNIDKKFTSYTIKEGDNITNLTAKFKMSIPEFWTLNPHLSNKLVPNTMVKVKVQ